MQLARIAAVASIATLALGCSMFFPHAALSPALATVQKVLLIVGAIGLAGSLTQLFVIR